MKAKHQTRFTTASITLTIVFYLVSTNINATLIAPGDSIVPPGLTGISNPELNGVVVNDNDIDLFLFQENAFVATYHYANRVISSNVGGATIIAPQLNYLNNITGSDFFIDQILLDGYAGIETDVSYRTDATGDRTPTNVDRSVNGDQLLFTFGFPIFSGNLVQEAHENSFPINILTNANAYELTGTATIFARSTQDITQTFSITLLNVAVPTFVDFPIGPNPPNNVSVPSSFSLLLLGVFGFIARSRIVR